MLGHLKPSLCQLSPENKQNYWLFYCAGCASLRKQNGLEHSMLLSNELTLLLCAFEGKYQDLDSIKTACPATALLLKRQAIAHPAIDKASQLMLLLAWIKALDWQTDNPSFVKKLILNHLAKKVKKIIPQLLPKSQKIIAQYAQLTQRNESDFNLIRQETNQLSQMLVGEIGSSIGVEEGIQTHLANLFGQIGELIALADHLIDLEKDMYGKQYNPILNFSQQNNVSLTEAYHWLKLDYQRLRYQIQASVNQEDSLFAEVLKTSLQQLDYKIEKAMPVFVKDTQTEDLRGRMQLNKASLPSPPPEIIQTLSDPCCDSCLSALGAACATACCECSCSACSNACCSNKETRQSRRKQNNQNQNDNSRQRQ